MIFVCIARYTEDADLIAAARPVHRAYAQSLRAAGRLLVAGPFADDSGAILVYEAGSADEVHELIARDPYQQRGVFVGAEVKQWSVIAGSDVEARLAHAGRAEV